LRLNEQADMAALGGANADRSEGTLIRLSIRPSLKRTGKEMKFIVVSLPTS
jgi:hypothetical protein